MGILEELRKSRFSPSSAHHQFLLHYKRDELTIHVFFEGQGDESFYMNFVYNNKPKYSSLFIYRCGNKKSVYETHQRIDWDTHQKSRALFFVDKDHADLLGEQWPNDENIYVTDFYSIENFLVNTEVLVRLLRELLHISDNEYIRCIISEFEIKLEQFYSLTRVLCAWMIFVRRLGLRPNVNNIELQRIFHLSDDLTIERSKASYTSLRSYLDTTTGIATPKNSWASIRAVASELKQLNSPKLYIRGKFELWFLVNFINKIPILLESIRRSSEPRIINRANINIKNAIEIIGPRTQVPQSLRLFLAKHWATLE